MKENDGRMKLFDVFVGFHFGVMNSWRLCQEYNFSLAVQRTGAWSSSHSQPFNAREATPHFHKLPRLARIFDCCDRNELPIRDLYALLV